MGINRCWTEKRILLICDIYGVVKQSNVDRNRHRHRYRFSHNLLHTPNYIQISQFKKKKGIINGETWQIEHNQLARVRFLGKKKRLNLL